MVGRGVVAGGVVAWGVSTDAVCGVCVFGVRSKTGQHRAAPAARTTAFLAPLSVHRGLTYLNAKGTQLLTWLDRPPDDTAVRGALEHWREGVWGMTRIRVSDRACEPKHPWARLLARVGPGIHV
jgi:hypothetical protein